MKRCLTAIVLGLAATAALAANDEGAWNAGVDATFGEYKFDTNQLGDSAAGFKLFAGYRFNQWLGAEGAYHNFGSFEEDLDPPNPGGSATADLDGFSTALLVYAPLASEDFEIYGKAGYYFFDQEVVVDNAVVGSNSPDGITLGVGARAFVSDQFAVRLGADWFDIDAGSLWALNVGAEYRFGRPEPVAAPVAAAVVATPRAAPPPAAPPPAASPPADTDRDGVIDPSDQCPETPAGAKVNSVGCEIQLVLRGVNFATNSAALTDSDSVILDSVAGTLAKRQNFDVNVVGHTDSTGSDAYNLDLSARRADAVRDYLIGKGIAAGNLTAEGKGESEPVASNETAEGRSENRRVTLDFTKRQ